MSDRVRLLLSALAILAVALIVWLPTIQWGLPSRDADKYLFGDRRPWTGAEIVALTATTQPADTMRGADVDADPILDRSKPVILNDTDAKRAAIVRRYRLMSGQPDEFIQFKALSEMAGRSGLAKLDPRLYQYGGLWVYPVGALVRTAMLVGYIPTPPPGTPAIEFYLDHPEAFGKFYVVARFYSWCWGVVAAFAIAWIARRVTESIGLATLAAVAFMLLPVTRTATHEAKPHLAGAALCLCAVIAATRYVETGRRRWLIGAGALCGAAMAMVVSMLLSCAVLPTMIWLRRRETCALSAPRLVADETPFASANPRQVAGLPASATTLITSLAVAAIVYFASNPFVLINAIAHPEILRSNLGNSTAMYSPRSDGIHAVRDAMRIAATAVAPEGCCVLAVMIPIAVFGRQRWRSVVTTSCLIGVVAILIATQFLLLANGKPAEYGRFGLVPAAAVCVAASIAVVRRRSIEVCLIAFIVATLVVPIQVATFALPHTVRSSTLANALMRHGERLFVNWPPAPWSAPAVNLFANTILLVDFRSASNADDAVGVFPTNLASQIHSPLQLEGCDWLQNRFARFPYDPSRFQSDEQSLNSDSRPAGSRPAE